ncbi:hypothetical protein Ctaglu_47750 [Clostridium tagluense]|uniref:Uncharacterized protein n=1 Tax=Clostridium tagluense TaxID=360422 RepID=A0A401UUC5_9CLOT|nr:hypothetical protein Ctaglu_47750 [Clostridium tagluense]
MCVCILVALKLYVGGLAVPKTVEDYIMNKFTKGFLTNSLALYQVGGATVE